MSRRQTLDALIAFADVVTAIPFLTPETLAGWSALRTLARLELRLRWA